MNVPDRENNEELTREKGKSMAGELHELTGMSGNVFSALIFSGIFPIILASEPPSWT